MTDADPLAALAGRVATLEAREAVRSVAMTYFRLCDDLGPHTDLGALGALFTRDAMWAGQGRYQAAFGRHDGRDAIVAMLAAYADPPHFALNAHYLASETIAVTGTGAQGQWAMLQASSYRDGRSDFRSARITIDFAQEDGAWRMSAFRTRAIFARDAAPWNDDAAISVPAAASSAAI